MKKYLLFILLLIVPFMVHAQDVKITDVTLLESTKGIEVDEKPTFENLKISFDLSFREVGEFAKYKVTVKNESKKDYEIENTTKFSDGEYIKYEFSYDGNKVVKAGEEKEFDVSITYNKEVPEELFENGKYTEKNAMIIDLSNQEKNPNTLTFLPIVIICLALVSILFMIKTEQKRGFLYLLLLGLIPLTIYALDKISIEIEASIEIEREGEFVFNTYCSSENITINFYSPSTPTEEIQAKNTYKFAYGMTWEEYLNSDYYQNLTEIQKANFYDFSNVSYYSYEYSNCMDEIDWSYEFEELSEEEYNERYEAAQTAANECASKYTWKSNVQENDKIINSDIGYYMSSRHCRE